MMMIWWYSVVIAGDSVMTIVILILIQFVTLAVEFLNASSKKWIISVLHLLLSYAAQSCKPNIRTPPLYLYSSVIRSPCLFKPTVSKIVDIISKSGIFGALLVLLIYKYRWKTQLLHFMISSLSSKRILSPNQTIPMHKRTYTTLILLFFLLTYLHHFNTTVLLFLLFFVFQLNQHLRRIIK